MKQSNISMNKFIIIMPCYNVAKWVALNIQLTKQQSFSNFECHIINDGSTDNSEDIILDNIKGDSRFVYHKNKTNTGSSLYSYYTIFHKINPNDEDIIIWLDGDDWFSSVFALQYLDQYYDITKCWMTYGTYQIFPSGNHGSHHCIDIPDEIHKNHSYRQWMHVYSHLRTHRAFLFKKLKESDLIDSRSGKFYTEATDCAYLFSLAELCGSAERIKCIKDILLVLNRTNPNQAASNLEKQKATEQHIRSLPVKKQLDNEF